MNGIRAGRLSIKGFRDMGYLGKKKWTVYLQGDIQVNYGFTLMLSLSFFSDLTLSSVRLIL